MPLSESRRCFLPHANLLACAGVVLCSLFVTLSVNAQQASTTENELVQRLDHRDYHTRLSIRRQIRNIGPTVSMRHALQNGTQSQSVEIRISSIRLLQQFDLDEFDQQIFMLLNPYIDSAEIVLPGWKSFSQIAGDDIAVRKVFSKIAKHHIRELRVIDELDKDSVNKNSDVLANLDPYRLSRDDSLTWSLLLLYDCSKPNAAHVELSSRILNALMHSGLCPAPNTSEDKVVFNRLVSHWLKTHKRTGNTRDRLVVSMRYGCHAAAHEICDGAITDPLTSPSSLATALLAASSLQLGDVQKRLVARIDDSRTSHVWQLIASRKTRIRTQVRDVAVALLLHDQGLDPRDFGFIEVQADPLLTFRDHSLGFADDTSREQAHKAARERLGL